MSLPINKNFKYGQMVALLTKLGYVVIRSTGSHTVFRHDNSDSNLLLNIKSPNQEIPLPIQASVFKNIISQKVSVEEEIKALISQIK